MFTFHQSVPIWHKLVLAGLSPIDSLEDGVFIMFHRNEDNYPLAVKPSEWASYQNSGEIADGVLVVDGTEMIVVAPEETTLTWSSAAVSAGGVNETDRLTAFADWEGKVSTSTQVTHEECADAGYAPGYCAAYSRVNTNGKGLTAGRWWLPSLAQLMCMFSNMNKINYALSKINGATQLAVTAYWSSTEAGAAAAWCLNLLNGGANFGTKATHQFRCRPISAFYN